MGCDIHTIIERKTPAGNWELVDHPELFGWRSYHMFAWLGGAHNKYGATPIAEGRGFPDDLSPEGESARDAWTGDCHHASWVSADELTEFDYRTTFRNALDGEQVSVAGFVGPGFFDDLKALECVAAGRPTRLVFWFDN